MKRHIRTKLMQAFLGISVTSMVIAGVAAGITLMNIHNVALDSNTAIGQNAADSSEKSLIGQAVLNMKDLSGVKAELIESSLQDTADNLREIRSYINYMYTHQDEFKPVHYTVASEVPAGQLSLQWCLASEAISFPAVEKEIFLHGNMKRLYSSVMGINPNVSTFYFSSESGISVGFDASPEGKPPYYDGRDANWYKNARDTGGLNISDTYQDAFGRGLTISMSLPCYGENHTFVGVVGLDILIEDLNEDAQKTTVLEDGYAMLIGAGKKIISAPGLTEDNQNDLTAFLGSSANHIYDQMQKDPNGVSLTELNGKTIYVVWASIPLTDWNYVLMVPYDNIVAPAKDSKDAIHALSDATAEDMQQQMTVGTLVFAALFLLIVLVVVYISMRLSKAITKPISTLNDEIRQVGQGDLEYVSTIKTGDEIEELSLSFETMTQELGSYIQNLARVTADKERIATELSVATHIQASMLPCIFPPYPDVDAFDIFATMRPAKEVGGDFYDFFLLDNDHLGVVMADVSGKGVPAALFMVIAKTLIKNHAQSGEALGTIFASVNAQLCENNDMGMFVTAFMGILEFSTGKFTFVNAGHNPPLIRRAGQGYEYLKTRAGFVLAGMEGMKYREQEITLRPGDRIYLYTDGVTEATDLNEELFGEDRLVEALDQTDSISLPEMLPYIQKKIDDFTTGAEQFDDITMLVVELK